MLLPGAFCPADIFAPTERWRHQGYGLVRYRFPGFDGRSAVRGLRIGRAAAGVAAFAARHPGKPLHLVGYSTGGAIALEAALRIGEGVRVALLSPALERAGGVETALRGMADIAAAAVDARSLQLVPVWMAYYRVLLYGRAARRDPALASRAQSVVEARRQDIVIPERQLRRAHTADLRRWRLPEDAHFARGQVHVFRGADDPVFSGARTQAFARRLGPAAVTEYPGHGHLIFASYPAVFDDVLAFLEDRPYSSGGDRLTDFLRRW